MNNLQNPTDLNDRLREILVDWERTANNAVSSSLAWTFRKDLFQKAILRDSEPWCSSIEDIHQAYDKWAAWRIELANEGQNNGFAGWQIGSSNASSFRGYMGAKYLLPLTKSTRMQERLQPTAGLRSEMSYGFSLEVSHPSYFDEFRQLLTARYRPATCMLIWAVSLEKSRRPLF